MKNRAEEIYNKRISEYLETHPMERFDDIPDVVFISAMQEYADLCKQDEGWVRIDDLDIKLRQAVNRVLLENCLYIGHDNGEKMEYEELLMLDSIQIGHEIMDSFKNHPQP